MKKIMLVFGIKPEAIESGIVKLVDTNTSINIKDTFILINNLDIYLQISRSINYYRDGFASKHIFDILKMNEL